MVDSYERQTLKTRKSGLLDDPHISSNPPRGVHKPREQSTRFFYSSRLFRGNDNCAYCAKMGFTLVWSPKKSFVSLLTCVLLLCFVCMIATGNCTIPSPCQTKNYTLQPTVYLVLNFGHTVHERRQVNTRQQFPDTKHFTQFFVVQRELGQI